MVHPRPRRPRHHQASGTSARPPEAASRPGGEGDSAHAIATVPLSAPVATIQLEHQAGKLSITAKNVRDLQPSRTGAVPDTYVKVPNRIRAWRRPRPMR